MFRVTADTLQEYLNFDPERKHDLVKLHKLMAKAAPSLKRYFHRGTPAGQAGMRMKMIGYGKCRYAVKSGQSTEWPVIGVALQKNYISFYVSVTKQREPIVPRYAGKLGELKVGRNNFNFERFDDLKVKPLSSLVAEVAEIFASDPENPVQYMQGV
ncbi:hypothetical protein ACVOMS_20550 [Bradyrhizobium guangxiense]